jgi:hypothetical protein
MFLKEELTLATSADAAACPAPDVPNASDKAFNASGDNGAAIKVTP